MGGPHVPAPPRHPGGGPDAIAALPGIAGRGRPRARARTRVRRVPRAPRAGAGRAPGESLTDASGAVVVAGEDLPGPMTGGDGGSGEEAAQQPDCDDAADPEPVDRKSTRLNSSHSQISY